MEEGTKSKRSVFVGNLTEDVDEASIYETFSTFGDIIEVVLPAPTSVNHINPELQPKHRGFAFVTYGSSSDAQDAIDNMDLNEMQDQVLRVNLAKPMKGLLSQPIQNKAIWESEEWLQEHVKPLQQRGAGQGQDTGPQGPDKNKDDDAMEE